MNLHLRPLVRGIAASMPGVDFLVPRHAGANDSSTRDRSLTSPGHLVGDHTSVSLHVATGIPASTIVGACTDAVLSGARRGA